MARVFTESIAHRDQSNSPRAELVQNQTVELGPHSRSGPFDEAPVCS
jgi:hypothetical protein